MAGPCEALHPRYYFDAESGKCRRFIYGGCGGNQNNFASMSECMNFCNAKVPYLVANKFKSFDECQNICQDLLNRRPSFCLLDKVVGPCMMAIPSYYYNKESGLCEKFIYGGCLGNKNNFGDLASCVSTCHADVSFFVF